MVTVGLIGVLDGLLDRVERDNDSSLALLDEESTPDGLGADAVVVDVGAVAEEEPDAVPEGDDGGVGVAEVVEGEDFRAPLPLLRGVHG